jgi:hypothetical protein
MGALTGMFAAAVLLAISLFSFVMGSIFRKWPEKVHECVEPLDGSAYLFSPETHRATTIAAGFALSVLSLVALIAAAMAL